MLQFTGGPKLAQLPGTMLPAFQVNSDDIIQAAVFALALLEKSGGMPKYLHLHMHPLLASQLRGLNVRLRSGKDAKRKAAFMRDRVIVHSVCKALCRMACGLTPPWFLNLCIDVSLNFHGGVWTHVRGTERRVDARQGPC